MLIENKFIFINLPRCASTSFHISCIKHGLNIQHSTSKTTLNKVKKFDENDIIHIHETIEELEKSFGKDYPVISIKRPPHERFISMWKHVIKETIRYGDNKTAKIFTNLNTNDILYYTHEDVNDTKKRHDFIVSFMDKNHLNFDKIDRRIKTMLNVLITPLFIFHKNKSDIIWFDIDKLGDLEKWVTEKLGKSFKMSNLNSSADIECNMKLNSEFIEAYDRIYGTFENQKELKTII